MSLPPHRITTPRRMRGFTLIELVVTLAVATILVLLATPSLRALIERRQLEGAVGELVDNLVLTRSQAIEKNRPAFISFSGSEAAWVYGLNEATSCNPAQSGTCRLNGSERVYRSDTWRNVRMSHSLTDAELSFDPRRGTVSDTANIQLSSPAGEVELSVSPIGYVSACSVGARVGRYPPCSG